MNKQSGFSPKKNEKEIKNMPHAEDVETPWLIARTWYMTHLGQALLEKEKNSLSQLLENVFGYNLVQLGCIDSSALPSNNNALITGSRTSYQYIFESLSETSQANACTQVLSNFEQLPIKTHTIDAVILPHTLEFESNPHQILREVERILVAEGKAIFLGFNPYSLWGWWHKYWELKKKLSQNVGKNSSITSHIPLPSCGHLISQKRLGDWLQLLGFDIKLVNEHFYRPPIGSAPLLKKLDFMEDAGQLLKFLPAGAYLMVATKRVSTLTPIKQPWKFSKKLLTPEPAGAKTNIHTTDRKIK